MRTEHATFQELHEMSTNRMIELIQQRRLSVLKSYGRAGIYRSLLIIRWIVGLALRIIFRWKNPENGQANVIDHPARARTVRLLRKFTPYKATFDHISAGKRTVSELNANTVFQMVEDTSVPLVIGFNHPSLGEIARLLSLCFELFPNKRLVFPVTLPWFEMFASYAPYFRSLGVQITPIVTPHATRTLIKGHENDEKAKRTLSLLRVEFQTRYLKLCVETAKTGGVILLAPSAQRQATVFPDIATFIRNKPTPPVMTMIVRKIMSEGMEKLLVLPCCVIPPKEYTKMLNLFKVYRLHYPEYFTGKRALNNFATGEFDYFFLRAISDSPGAEGFKHP